MTKTLIFGLDGFDFAYARQLAQDSQMPWLRERLSEGSLVTTVCPDLPGSEWVNAACGVSAAQHGYVHTSQLRVGTYEMVDIDARVVDSDPFYVPLANSGAKTIVVDLCVDRPRPMDNLVQVIDWATEFKLFHYCTTPKELRRFVDQRCPNHPLTNYGVTDPSDSNLRQLNEKLGRGITLKGELIKRLMQANSDWSVFFAGFGEIHKGGHFFWQYQDPSHPQYPGPDHALAPALRNLYVQLDAALRELCRYAGKDTNVMLVTDRGMRANHRGDHLVQALLVRLGLLRIKGPAQRDVAKAVTNADVAAAVQARRSVTRRLKAVLPVSWRPMVRRLLGKDSIDWSRTSVFQIADVGNSYLRINLKGREPRGLVVPAEYEELLNKLEREFMSLRDPNSGKCPVREVVFPQRKFDGPFRDGLPDFGVIWECAAPLAALQSASVGRLDAGVCEQRSGNHTERGAILASGPSFSGFSERDGDLRELAPTLLELHGLAPVANHEFAPMSELRT